MGVWEGDHMGLGCTYQEIDPWVILLAMIVGNAIIGAFQVVEM